MCLAIAKPAGKTLDKADMHRAYIANPDGCGFAVRSKGKIRVAKGLWTFAEFWERFAPVQHLEALVHFRMASAGSITPAMAHPFKLVDGSALIHNGHLSRYGYGHVSDTAHWVASVLNPLLMRHPEALRDVLMRTLLEDSIGNSKMVILPKTGTPILLNEEAGIWEKGIWYSQIRYRHSADRQQQVHVMAGHAWQEDVQGTIPF